ncbi:DNA-binding Lrp family transcriptional regulator [Mumia flava]|uniref:DNA-binding Lrp family transcriptional regulator n=1 Tax=Mumia flava TaxID=1348852 RepID=A0A2M9BGJ5_9ACTN|nr:Lrp/AsnC family transcriptional regulator [Mumia flava]PJJ57070.1 DNA-binding Lrp family transcriptional regulator [Mumia flava]
MSEIELDDVDHRLLSEVAADGRIANNVLARRLGIAPSTCLTRTRRLIDAGVIRGFHAELDLAALGRPLQAMISIRLQPSARNQIEEFQHYLTTLPGVINVYFLAGTEDFQIHVAAPDGDALRDFVVGSISRRREVAGTHTSLIFSHVRPPLAV